mmetsp:Transcript_4438/g.8890  ORF Transcript_4438/g.8890 Transcript_4438/m.8890 type:complete len:202 (+) Transcript_4438:47-652(+)
MAGKGNNELRTAVEAARAAILAVHAAAGLCNGARQPTRLLRAAEGLCRSALATLRHQPVSTPSPPDAAVVNRPGRQKARGKNKKNKQAAAASAAAAMVIDNADEHDGMDKGTGSSDSHAPQKDIPAAAPDGSGGIPAQAEDENVVIPPYPAAVSQHACGLVVKLLAAACWQWATEGCTDATALASTLARMQNLLTRLEDKG